MIIMRLLILLAWVHMHTSAKPDAGHPIESSLSKSAEAPPRHPCSNLSTTYSNKSRTAASLA